MSVKKMTTGETDTGESTISLHPRLQKELLCHQGVIEAINPNRGDRGHHSFLFSGQRGIGKATAAYTLARMLLGCGAAGEERLIEVGSHPDLLTLEPEEGKSVISTEKIRQINQFLSHSPARGGWRLVIVDCFDDVNFNGANAMLKILEEPPSRAVIILINHQSRAVLPTIRSRCQMVRFQNLDLEATRQRISAMFPEADPSWIDTASILADGAPGKAWIFAETGAADLYADTCAILADSNPLPRQIDDISRQWGKGGVAGAGMRQAARLLFDRLITHAAKHASGVVLDKPVLEVEQKAITAIATRLAPAYLGEMHQKMIAQLNQAEALNLGQAWLFYRLISALIAQR